MRLIHKNVLPVIDKKDDTNFFYVKIKVDVLNIKEKSCLTSNIISTTSKGSILKIVEINNGWGKIEDSGWINLEHTERI